MTWHLRLYRQAYTAFGVAPRAPADSLAYWTAVAGRILFLGCMGFFWIVLNCATLFFGVFVEPLWRSDARFRRLQLPGRIPAIAVCLPVLLTYAAYRTYEMHGLSHVIGPFLLVACSAVLFLGSLSVFNILRRKLPPAAAAPETGE